MKKKINKKKRWIVIAASIAVIGICIHFRDEIMELWYEYTTGYVMYPEFGISIPTGYQLHGIDVSKYQENVNWNQVKDMKIKDVKIDFVFVKATEGLINVDRFYKRNWKKLQEKKITRGAYLYFLAYRDGKMQAQNFIKNVQLQKGDLPPVVDVEEIYRVQPDVLKSRLKECLIELEQFYKVKPILYSYVNFYENYLGDDFNNYPLWVAHYFENNKPRINRKWQFWQHSDKGKVNGIYSNVDFNVFSGDSLEFRKLLLK